MWATLLDSEQNIVYSTGMEFLLYRCTVIQKQYNQVVQQKNTCHNQHASSIASVMCIMLSLVLVHAIQFAIVT